MIGVKAQKISAPINKNFRATQRWHLVLAVLLTVQIMQMFLGIGAFLRSADPPPMQSFHTTLENPAEEDPPVFNSTLIDLLDKLSLSATLPAFGDFPAYRGLRPASQIPAIAFDCGMHTCFDFDRCRSGFTVYIYPDDPEMKTPTGRWWGWHSFKLLNQIFNDHFRVVTDPRDACVFLPPFETSCETNVCSFDAKKVENALQRLPHWNNGLNHLILYYGNDYDWPPFNTGQAIILSASMVKQSYRPGFDVMLPIINFQPPIVKLNGTSRDLLLYFQGGIYNVPDCMDRGRHLKVLSRAAEENEDVVLLGLCSQAAAPWETANVDKPDFPEVCRSCKKKVERCTDWKRSMPIIDYKEGLHRAKFGWAPRGCGPLSYRLMEVIFTGGVPVQTGDDVVLPFAGDDTEISRVWRQCVVFPTESSLPFLIDGLRNMPHEEYTRRLNACQSIVRSKQNDLYHLLWLGICTIAKRVKRGIVNSDISKECGQLLEQFSEFR